MFNRREMLAVLGVACGSVAVQGISDVALPNPANVSPLVRSFLVSIADIAERVPDGRLAVFDFVNKADFVMTPADANKALGKGMLVVDRQSAAAIRSFATAG